MKKSKESEKNKLRLSMLSLTDVSSKLHELEMAKIKRK